MEEVNWKKKNRRWQPGGEDFERREFSKYCLTNIIEVATIKL